MSKNDKNGGNNANFSPENTNSTLKNQDTNSIQSQRDYENLVNKSLDEQITDTQVTRADITNPNLHYGLEDDLESIASARDIQKEADSSKFSDQNSQSTIEENARPETDNDDTSANNPISASSISEADPLAEKAETIQTNSFRPVTPEAKVEQPIENEGSPPPSTFSSSDGPAPVVTPVDGTTATEIFNPDLVVTGDNIDENSAAGTVIATLNLEDAAGTNYTYYISDANGSAIPNDNFQIIGSSVVVAPTADLDYETAPSHDFYITGIDASGNKVTEQFTVTINDVNEFSVSAISDTDAAANSLAENSAIGTPVGITAFATDADGSNNTVTYSLSDDAGGLFAIDPNTGEVSVAGPLDYETATNHNIEVTATSSDGSTSTQNYNIALTDQDEFDVSAISDTDGSANSVAENSAVGTSVGITALATDADGSDTVTYSLSDDASGLFAIDPNTGEVTVAGNLDYETATSHNIEVTATSSDGSTSTQNYNIALTDQDEFDVSAISDTDAAANTVAENSAVGTSVGITALATDADGSNNTVTYSLSDDAGGLFAIDPNTGEVTVAGNLDYETATSHNIEVTATSSDGSTSTQNYNIALTDQDEFDVSVISDTDGSANNVDEDASVGDVVGITALATDADGSNNTVTYSLSDDAGGLFAIDANTGVITVAGGLDAETATSHNIEVTATSDDGSTSTANFSIGVNDVNETSISAISDNNGANNEVSESAAIGTAVGITALATDADVTDTVTYSLSSNPGGFFAIDATTGVVTVANGLDFETSEDHTIEVTATSTDGSTSTETFTINVTDEDEADVSTISDTDAAANTVAENSAVGTSVGITALATDADGSDTVTYSLSDDAGGLFAIDPNTGEVTVAGNLDYETATSHNIEVTATSSDGSTSTQNYNIALTDQDEFDVSAISDTDAAANTVAENSAVGTSVGITALATDADGSNNTVTYSLSDDAGGLFAIDPNTGEVTVAGNLDYETATSHNIEVTATSSDGSTSTQNYNIALTDQDEFDVSVISDTDGSANNVDEDASVGDVVGITALATDADGSNNTVTYSLSDDAGGLFAIDANTGVITVAGGLDAETATSHNIEVTATSDDGSTSTANFSIGVNDVNETSISAISDNNGANNEVSESAAIGTAVGITALATDADVTDTVTYSLSSNPGGFFAIDATTGVVTVANGLDFETSEDHTIEVTATSTDGSTSTETFTINVTDEDEADVSTISDTDAAANTVAENSAVGTSVGITALATDADGSDTVTYSLSDDAGGLFAIDPNTGEVTVAGNLDYETATSHNIEVTATSSDGSTSTQNYNIALTDQDEFDVSAISDTDAAANTVAENSAVGTSVGITALATDADGSNNTVTYSLSDDAGGLFAIDPNTGEVTVAGNLDYETATSHNIEVTATSSDGSTSTQNYNIALTDQDEFDVSVISDTDGSANNVDEDASVGDVVGITALATDADGSNNTVTYSLSDDAGGLFAIDANTGVITVAGGLDAETATSHNIEVTATSDDGSTSTANFSIGVNDVNETSISAISDNNGANNEVSESAAIGTAVGITALATDADVTDTVTYSLSSNPGGFFAIDATTGVVTVANGLDFETSEDHTIEVTATSTDGSTSTETFTINVTDEDEADVSAISDTDGSANSVAENSAVGTSVGITALATDADGSDTVTYSLSDDAGGLFAIDPNTGEVTVAGNLDYETATSHNIEVTATSSDGSTSTQNYNIALTDENEAPTDVSLTGIETTVSVTFTEETAGYNNSLGVYYKDADGNPVAGEIIWSDADAQNPGDIGSATFPGVSEGDIGYFLIPNGGNDNPGLTDGTSVSFIQDGDGNWMAVTENGDILEGQGTNVLFSGDGSLNEDGMSHTNENGNEVAFEDTLNGGDADYRDIVFTTDVTENDTETLTVRENSDGAFIGNLSTSDPDSGDTHTYSVSDNRFEVVGNELKLKDDVSIDYDTETSIDITVTTTDSGGITHQETFTVNVEEVYEAPIDIEVSSNSVDENASAGTVVATLNTIDPNSDDSFTYSLTNDPSGFFEIVGDEVRVKSGADIDYETATSHTVTVEVTDASGATYSEDIQFNVNDLQEGATPTDISFKGNSDLVDASQITAGTVVASVTSVADADVNDTFTYELSDNADGKYAIDNSTGEITIVNTHSGASLDSDTVTVRVTDSNGNAYEESVGIHLGTNEADTITGGDGTDIIYGLDSGDSSSSTTPLSVTNSGFQNVSTSDGQYIVGDTPGWTGTGAYGIYNPQESVMSGVEPGGNLGMIDDNSTMSQTLGDTFNAASTYDITLEVGTLNGYNTSPYEVRLYAGDQLVDTFSGTVPSVGSMTEVSFSLNGAGYEAYNGQNLRLEVAKTTDNGSYVAFDKVQISEVELDTGDTLSGGAGDDWIYGGTGNDIINGDEGNDVLYGGEGADQLDGGSGIDTVSFENADEGVTLAFSDTDGSGIGGSYIGESAGGISGDAEGDSYSNFEIFEGSDHADNVYGATTEMTYNLGDGNDTFDNSEALDTVDTVNGGAGDDSIWTGGGDDIISGGTGNDMLSGENGNDTLTGGAGNDDLHGGDGSDLFIFQEGDGHDTVNGGAGGGWTDTIELQDEFGGSDLGTYGSDWTVTLSEGSIDETNADSLVFSDDADGTITLQDGSTIDFTDVERIEW